MLPGTDTAEVVRRYLVPLQQRSTTWSGTNIAEWLNRAVPNGLVRTQQERGVCTASSNTTAYTPGSNATCTCPENTTLVDGMQCVECGQKGTFIAQDGRCMGCPMGMTSRLGASRIEDCVCVPGTVGSSSAGGCHVCA
eukprot:208898-Rhodomonas_salina.1